MNDENRRPLTTRSASWAKALAAALAKAGCTPNGISLFSLVLALVATLSFVVFAREGGQWWWLLVAVVGIQGRLVCNMLDGMVAVEGGLSSPVGEIYNELPDRLADVMILLPAGYAAGLGTWGPLLGWTSSVLAVSIAYVRALGVAAGAGQQFAGPMAKPHRMFALTLGCLVAAVSTALGADIPALALALAVIILGSVVTLVRRTLAILARLR